MERKNEICKAGQQYLDSMDEFQRYHTNPREAFIDGAKWADEHPKPDMVNKQEFIEKACEWLLNNAHLYVYATTKEKRALMFDNFKKAMEE